MATMTRDEFAAIPAPTTATELFLPCGPDNGCDYDECAGWCTQEDDSTWSPARKSFEFRRWTAAEVEEARRYRDTR